jgi:hypothetical protein
MVECSNKPVNVLVKMKNKGQDPQRVDLYP